MTIHETEELHQSIGRILWDDWDPIGVNGNPELADEYSSYVSQIRQMLMQGADTLQISDHLKKLELDVMGLNDTPLAANHRKSVAAKVCALYKTPK